MRFAFDDEQKMLQAAVRGELAREAPLERIRAWSEEGELTPIADVAARQGWTGIGVAEDDGGQGGGLVEQAILFEELGRAAAPSGGLLAAAIATALTGGGLPDVVDGSRRVAVVWPADRSLDDPSPFAAAPGLRGCAPLVLAAPEAELLLIPSGGTIWALERATDGVAVQERVLLDRTRRFGDVTIWCVKGTPVAEVDDLAPAAARAAVLVAAESLGLARVMLETTVAYVRDRRQFGVPVGSFQAVKHAAAEALVAIEAAHSGVYYAAWAVGHDCQDGPVHAWIAKSYACEAAAHVADVALQLHGAIGYTWEYDLHVYFKRAKANAQLFGDARRYRERIADTLALTAPVSVS
jgi:alkylation response protein AidB-like acyl-CoA dehydrogenase